MAGHTGSQNKKTLDRIAYVKKYYDAIMEIASNSDKIVLEGIKLAKISDNSYTIAKTLPVYASSVNYVLRKYENYFEEVKSTISDTFLDVVETEDAPYTIITDKWGEEFVPHEEVKQLLNQPKKLLNLIPHSNQ